MILTVIIPVYNEIKTIEKIVLKIKSLKNIKTQIIIVDDGSIDGTKQILKKKIFNIVDIIIYHKINRGKGAAIISAKKYIKGDFVIIQDADLEYDPRDYYKLILPIKNKKYKVVYGSRLLKKSLNTKKKFTSSFRVFGNYILTIFSNIINSQNLTDAHTCYKVFEKKTFDKLNIVSKDFAFCSEVNTKLSKMGVNILELPIRYKGRRDDEGKKIKLVDGLIAIYTIIKFKFFI